MAPYPMDRKKGLKKKQRSYEKCREIRIGRKERSRTKLEKLLSGFLVLHNRRSRKRFFSKLTGIWFSKDETKEVKETYEQSLVLVQIDLLERNLLSFLFADLLFKVEF